MKTKTVLITGAGTGIGKDTAKSLLARGHTVYATTHYQAEVAGLKKELGESAHVFKLDITCADDRAQIADLEIDVLINNAGQGQSGSLAEIDIDRVRQLFEVNLFASLELTQIALQNMVRRNGGTIIFISSIVGRVPAPFMMPYSMTKFSLSAAAAGLREEMKVLDKGIHVPVVEPGPYHTGFNQTLSDSRFEWMAKDSLFSRQQIAKMKTDTNKQMRLLESKSTASVVRKIVSATEARKPRLRYVAPLHFAILVRLARILGV
ncbi:short-chain dehydrogenase [Marinobacter maroccanus]|uniref:Short-chain dehydrogenase n=1 Tax=Marinobacter maroccanus TaxID=2055143 RepID=A0A2S5Z515_9GAMM|nr:SDR family NAD(P)-dependent oxidoreductase [Marinobacter maroccanus]PPI82467.1 short-chain dehydrogenase [Marinobacter maroccanus]